MKRIVVASLTFLLIAAIVFALTVGSKTISGGTMFKPIKKSEQSTADLAGTSTAVFSIQEIHGHGWTLFVLNTGANPLVDLDVKAVPDIGVTTYAVELDADHANYSHVSASNCSDTLASGATCVVTSSGDDVFGYLQVDAKAAASTVTDVKVILYENTD